MRRMVLFFIVLITAVPAPGRTGPITHDACPGIQATTTLFKQVGPPMGPGDTLENLGFDGLGYLWISNAAMNRIERYDDQGTLTGFFNVQGPGAITRRADGLMYANTGDSLGPALLARLGAPGQASVVKFDPAIPISDPTNYATVVASGFKMANGGIFDAAGNYYLSNDVDYGLTKILPSGSVDTTWTAQASNIWGTNGLVVAGATMYAAITFDQRSPIVRIPLAAPYPATTLVETTFGVVSLEPKVYAAPQTTQPLIGLKGLDDMTIGPDGRLWVVANGMGELLRVDLGTGSVCLAAGGLTNPSSIRFADTFGPYTGDAFVTEFSGAIRRISISPA
ncbi:MAG: SMP-30/gluconolactonase/LRE family protein [Actinomycetota bacterium]